MTPDAIGAQARRFEERDHEGQPARAVIAERVYPTGLEDMWDALTNAERLPRWFLPVEGDLRPGGRYQLQGNAGGTITRCEAPVALDVTWEFGGGISWVCVRLSAQDEGTLLVLEHIAPVGVAEEHWESFGPAATGTGWDLALMGLGLHVPTGEALDPKAVEAWTLSDEGKRFIHGSTEAWARAHVAAGADPQVAQGMAQRTAAFYTGEG